MTSSLPSIGALTDRDLLSRIQQAVAAERRATAELVALLVELDARQLYLQEGCASLFTYCTQILHLSEYAAYNRIEAARAAQRFPTILERLADGRMHLTAVRLVARHLTPGNHAEVLDAVAHKSKRSVEEFVAAFQPQPDARTIVRKIPDGQTASAAPEPQPPPGSAGTTSERRCAGTVSQGRATPLAPERYKVQFTVSRETYEQLRCVQDLLRHTIPSGDVGAIFTRALQLLLKDVTRTKLAAVQRPRAAAALKRESRHIPAAIRREVWARDGGRCAFHGAQGRCTETGFLEFHHRVPFADGGPTTSSNLELRCRAHNAFESEQWFGATAPPMVREARDVYG